ncbi:MAG: ABC transporter ATP-binding protein, partial [Erysipelothrix sp.]
MKQTKTKKYLKEYLNKYRFDSVVTLMIFTLIAIAQFLLPLVTQRVIDDVIPNQDTRQLVIQLMYLLGLTIIIGVLTYVSTILINRISQNTISQLRNDLYDHILKLDYRYFEDHKTGDTLERINSDISVIQNLISPNTFSIFGSLITFTWIIGYIFVVDWKLMLILSITFPILFVINRYFSKRVKQAYRIVRTTSSEINSHLQTTLTLIPLIKVSRTERYELRRFEKLTRLNNEANDEATQVQAAYGPTVSLVDTVGTMIVLGYGALMVMMESITIGSVVTYLSYLALLQKPMKSFSSMVSRFQQASVSLERIDEV